LQTIEALLKANNIRGVGNIPKEIAASASYSVVYGALRGHRKKTN